MPILESDIRLLASQVMTDADNAGGAATGTVILDGVSNSIFPDVSELDHVEGRVQLRKVFVSVDTADHDTYLGANVILAAPPANPDVSAVLFATGDDFDQRTSAATRIESYLAAGPTYPGYLFGNHIAGQMTVTLQQRTTVPLPLNGDTLVLVKLPGTANELRQYVRVTDVSATTRTFTGSSNGADVTFERLIVILTISDALLNDFPGFEAVYQDASVSYTGKTQILETVVANAARYYGIVPLTSAAAFGDGVVKGDGIFAQLVPSSRTEVAITDARMNQQLSTLLGTGVSTSFSNSGLFDVNHPVYVGGGITSGSLSVTDGIATINDKGGKLVDTIGTVVGLVDYANGLLTLSTSVFGTGASSRTYAYSRAAPAALVGESLGVDVTIDNRRVTWATTFAPVPARGSMQVSYLSGGHWYVLSDDGSGAIRGSDSSFGVGVLNFTTGTLALTLGALPDVGSSIIYEWSPAAATNAVIPTPTSATASSSAFVEIDMGGPVGRGSLTITWAGHSATDSGGFLLGDASGTVDYGAGVIRIAPNALPVSGTVLTAIATSRNAATQDVAAFTSSGTNWTGVLAPGGGIAPGTVSLAVLVSFPARVFPGTDSVLNDLPFTVVDDGAGALRLLGYDQAGNPVVDPLGSVDYATGAFSLTKNFSLHTIQDTYGTVYPLGTGAGYVKRTGTEERIVTATMQNGGVGSLRDAAFVTYATIAGPSTTVNVTLAALTVRASLMRNGVLSGGATFTLGGDAFLAQADNSLEYAISPSTGRGTNGGSWVAATGVFTVTAWQGGASPLVTNFSAAQSPPTTVAAATTLLTDGVTFRTASAPIASSGFQISGTGPAIGDFNVTAGADGTIVGTHVFGTIDYNTGIVRLRFGTPTASAVSATIMDISSFAIPGVTNLSLQGAAQDSLRYNAVAYDYIPLDPSILGLDPVRLPSDGRVPIFRKGGAVVVHHTQLRAPQTVADGDTVDLGVTRLATVKIVGHDGVTITAGYAVDLDAGHVLITASTGWSQPITISHRIEDMALVTDAQLDGTLKLSRALSHAYPLGAYVSSALLLGDMFAHVTTLFEQQTWTGVWQDTVIGNTILAAYDQINHPVALTNAGAVTESWALIFTGNTSFNIIGEHLGVVGVGNTATDCAPLNPNTGVPYFTLAAAGFGTGWAVGNVIRLDTVGALEPLWLARVVQQGDSTLADDSFTVLVRGDVNA